LGKWDRGESDPIRGQVSSVKTDELKLPKRKDAEKASKKIRGPYLKMRKQQKHRGPKMRGGTGAIVGKINSAKFDKKFKTQGDARRDARNVKGGMLALVYTAGRGGEKDVGSAGVT